MVVLIGVALVSTAAWMISLVCPRSAARRHLVLSTALVASLLLPVAVSVRSSTDWTFLVIPSPAIGREKVARHSETPLTDQPAERLREQTEDGAASTSSVRATQDIVRKEQDAPGPSVHQERAAERSPTVFRRSEHEKSATTSAWVSAKRWGTVAYTCVAGALLLQFLASLAAVFRVKRRAIEVDLLPNGVHVLEADVTVPLAFGLGKSAIVLPRGFRGSVGPDELRDVLAHEAEHLKRGDHWIMLLQRITAALYWPIVTVHLLNRALVRAREELCDNAVLAVRDPAAYGQTLLTVAERASRKREFVAQAAPSVVWRGELERRIAGLLDNQRDRRTRVSRRVRWIVAASLFALAALAATTRTVVVADEPPPGESESAERDAAESEPRAIPAPRDDIDWTGIPKVDPKQPTLHRGVVLSPDGTPLAGASIYAASTIELLELADAEDVDASDLGPVRAVTDEQGRFEFHTQDLSWVTPAGERKRWETLLVATKEGVVPGWRRTWGEDRGLRSHWHPHIQGEVAVRTRPPATLTGQLLLEGGEPLAKARVRLTGLMAPVDYDLEKHIPLEEEDPLSLFETVDYEETLYRPWVLPGLKNETTTDEDGRFELPGLPEGFIARIEVTHPQAETTSLRVAVRPIEPAYRKRPFWAKGEFKEEREPTPTLYGSGFTKELPKGAVLRGRVTISSFLGPRREAAGVIVALANQNAKDGMSGQRFRTDADGRFVVTGLPNRPQGYDLAFVGSFAAPAVSHRERIVPGAEASVELRPAVPYRLKLTDPEGNPVDRDVYSIQVQMTPNTASNGVKDRFNDAERIAPGVYEGIVPTLPAAVVVKRKKADRPAAVDPKSFFEPGRTDWTREEARYAYGDAWRIVRPSDATIDQLEMAAVVFTNANVDDGVLELTATVHSDPPVEVTLVDETGEPVTGASVTRQLKRYNGKDLPATFSAYGLHPERAEFLVFTHEERGLIGTLSKTWTSDRVRVVMQPAATLIGRITDASGEPDFNFGIRVLGERIMPDTYVAGRVSRTTDEPGKRKGEFRLLVPPGAAVRGDFVRKTPDWEIRPSVGTAFGPLTPEPGETVDLGRLSAP